MVTFAGDPNVARRIAEDIEDVATAIGELFAEAEVGNKAASGPGQA